MTPDQLYHLRFRRPADKEAHTHAGALALARAALRRYPVALAAFVRAVADPTDAAHRDEMLDSDLFRDRSTVSPDRLGEALAFLSWVREGAALATYGPDETPQICGIKNCGATVAKGSATCGRCNPPWTPAEVLPVRSAPTVIDRLARLGCVFRDGMTRAEAEARAEELPLVAAHAAAVAAAYEAAAKWYEAIGRYLDIVEHPSRATVDDERRVTDVINGISAIVERAGIVRHVRTAAAILSYAPSEVIKLCSSRANCGRPVQKGAELCETHQGEHRRRRPPRSRLHRRSHRPHRQASPAPIAIARRAPAGLRWSVAVPYFVAAIAVVVMILLARAPVKNVADQPNSPRPQTPIVTPDDKITPSECRATDALVDKKPSPPPPKDKPKKPERPSPKPREKPQPDADHDARAPEETPPALQRWELCPGGFRDDPRYCPNARDRAPW